MALSRSGFVRSALLLLASGFAVLLGLGAALVWLVWEARSYGEGIARAQEVRLATAQVMVLLQDAETGQRGYLLTGEPRYLEPYRHAAAELPRRLPAFAALVAADGGNPDATARLGELTRAKLAELAETVALAETGARDRALAVVLSDAGKRAMDEAREVVAGIEARGTARLEGRRDAFAGR